jgi:transglutaminase-like putative cysteine protease
MNELKRRDVLRLGAAAWLGTALPWVAAAEDRHFALAPGPWRTFELTTRVEVADAKGATRLWLPVPVVDSTYQRSFESGWSGNAISAGIVADPRSGAQMLQAEFDPATARPRLELTSRVQTRSRATDWAQQVSVQEDPATLRRWTEPTPLMPTDGIVRSTALEAVAGARGDVDKSRRIYDWVVAHTHREPKVRGCGVGDLKTMLETADFGGKCADINGLFVGLCRSVGIPARDLYGIRLVPSAFGYRELGGNPAKLQGAQHCRAEVFLKGHGWVAMDPADVGKVMRLESKDWIKDTADPLVAPVNRALFGGWEGNWLGFNSAQDVALPGSAGAKLGFLMYPQAENANGRYDSLDADNFKYTITARELST